MLLTSIAIMANSRKMSKSAGWNLYWVFSDGLEDCFVVARNIRSAIKVECEMNGFDVDEVGAVQVCRIPENVAKRQLDAYKKDKIDWPWYGWNDLLKKLGAEFREIEGQHEILLDGVVYSQGERPRTIGARFIKEFRQDKRLANYGEEDRFSNRQNILFTLLGACIARCQQIEHYIAHSFILAVGAKEKARYKTIDDLTRAWKRKTMGHLIRTIEESYDLEPTFKAALEWFLARRNQLVHGLTTHPQYEIETAWGQDEMIAFLSLFEMMSRVIRKAFRACYLVSMDYGNSYVLKAPNTKIRFTKKQKDEMSIFPCFFILKKLDEDAKRPTPSIESTHPGKPDAASHVKR
jgi:hypothetical protein